ncbi:hypothetical protein [Anatilimnocola floriformis]|nr:hypothetical protein [Anatilimnocola floriformis]
MSERGQNAIAEAADQNQSGVYSQTRSTAEAAAGKEMRLEVAV